MKERPANLTAAEVRGILDGTLTSFRRPIRSLSPDPGKQWQECLCDAIDPVDRPCITCSVRYNLEAPPWKPGDRLWVRETWGSPGPQVAAYRADGKRYGICPDGAGGRVFVPHDRLFGADKGYILPPKFGVWRPSTQMPRWASRIGLEVVESQPEKDAAGVWAWVVSFRRVKPTTPKLTHIPHALHHRG